MADLLGRMFRMIAPVVIERLDQRRPRRHRVFSAERIIGKRREITGTVEQSFGHQMNDLFRAALNGAFDQDQPRAHHLLADAFAEKRNW